MNTKFSFVLLSAVLVTAALAIVPVYGHRHHDNFFQGVNAQTTSTGSGHHFFRGGGFRGGLGLGAGIILNPATLSSGICPPSAPVPVSNGLGGTYCLSYANAGSDVQEGYVSTPSTPIIIGSYTFGGLGGFGFHHFHR
jgi:hypothetical protein